MYGFVITTAGESMLARASAGETLTITGVQVGKGVVASAAAAKALTALVDFEANATSSEPAVSGSQLSMIVEYRNDLGGGLDEGFDLSEFGIFASVGDDSAALLYYASLGDAPQPVQPESAGLDVHRFPVAVAVTGELTVTLDYPAGAFVSADELDGYIPITQKGAAGGVASLGSNGKVPEDMLPEMNYLPTAGGTMTGAIAMGGNKITGLAAPTEDADASTKKYVDDNAGGKRAARFTVGTSTAGWTAKDCDYLCDGTADDVEINAAIQALPSTGCEIVLLDGTYNLAAQILVDKSNTTLRGNGFATILSKNFRSSNTTTGPAISISGEGSRITALSLLYGATSSHLSGDYGIQIKASDCQVDNCKIDGLYHGVHVNSGGYSARITQNYFSNCQYGVWVGEAWACIAENHISSETCIWLADSNIRVVANHIDADTAGIDTAAAGTQSVITGNHIFSNGDYGIDLISSYHKICGNHIKGETAAINCSTGSNYNVIVGNYCAPNIADAGQSSVIESNREVS